MNCVARNQGGVSQTIEAALRRIPASYTKMERKTKRETVKNREEEGLVGFESSLLFQVGNGAEIKE